MLKISLTIIGLILSCVIALDVAEKMDLRFIDAMERQAYDIRVRWSGSLKQDDRIVIIDIDEESIAKIGQWPWPRATIAKLTNQLFDQYKVDTFGFDVVFAEPEDDFSEEQVLQAFNKSQQDPASSFNDALKSISGDQQFANALRNRSIVMGYSFDQEDSPSVGLLPKPAFSQQDYDNLNLYDQTSAPIARRYTANIPILQQAAARGGFFSLGDLIDPDGIIRRAALVGRFDGKLYPSFSLELAQSYLQENAKPIVVDTNSEIEGLEGLEFLHTNVLLDYEGASFVPYSKSSATYQYISAWRVIEGELKNDISDTIAILGTSATGLVDLRSTPVNPSFPGVEVHANMVSAILDSSFRAKPVWVRAIDSMLLLLIGVIFSVLLPRLSAINATVLFLAASGSMIALNIYMWSNQLVILTIAPILLLLLTIYILNMVVGFFAESRSRAVMQSMFGLYVPPEVVMEMSKNSDIYSLKSQKRDMTVLFCDVRSFTNISESMEPDDLSELLNAFLTPMTEVIHKHGGAIDKYIGDAIMAFWGAPLPSETHAEDGVAAALEMIERLKSLNVEFKQRGWPELRIGIGVSSGLISVGNMGSKFRMAYTVMGDTVNVASRIEDLTKEYGVELIVSQFTQKMAPQFRYRQLDTLKVKGKDLPVTIYECYG